jgi:hypothetical protein
MVSTARLTEIKAYLLHRGGEEIWPVAAWQNESSSLVRTPRYPNLRQKHFMNDLSKEKCLVRRFQHLYAGDC